MIDIKEDSAGIIFNADGTLELVMPKDVNGEDRQVKDHELIAVALMYGLSTNDDKLHEALESLMNKVTEDAEEHKCED